MTLGTCCYGYLSNKLTRGLIDYDPALLQVDQCDAKQTTNYDVIVQSYHRIPISLDWRTNPSVVVARTMHAIHPGPQFIEMKRDIIWVECKASSGNQSGDWSEVMSDAVAKLHSAHPRGPLYFILNVGVEWLMFYWDPTKPVPAGQQLRMVDADGTTIRDVDPRVRPPPGINAYHIGPDNVVNTVLARSLDCFSMTQVVEQPKLAYQNDLDYLEQCIDVMINHQGYQCRHSHQD